MLPPEELNFLRTAADRFCTDATEVVLLTMVCIVRWKVTTVLTGAPDELRENEYAWVPPPSPPIVVVDPPRCSISERPEANDAAVAAVSYWMMTDPACVGGR